MENVKIGPSQPRSVSVGLPSPDPGGGPYFHFLGPGDSRHSLACACLTEV